MCCKCSDGDDHEWEATLENRSNFGRKSSKKEMKTTIDYLTLEELFIWVKMKDADIQYDLFDPEKQVPSFK